MGNDDLPLEHIARNPLPWRPEDKNRTECGLPVAGHPVISHADFNAKIKRVGAQRTALTTCMTCYHTARTYPYSWDEKPASLIAREANRGHWNGEGKDGFGNELRAIAILIQRHRAEFDELIEDHAETVPLPVKGRRRET